MASRKGLSPAEILSEWKLYATMEDPECEGKCVCGKTGLRYLIVKDQMPSSRAGVSNSNWSEGHILEIKCFAGHSLQEKSFRRPQYARKAIKIS